ncbi:hypothetical protein PUN28_001552 [Cardiocondyla obscurior]|uniref:Uncharacterized protein n=1 Tax=Cardiocondyla obscurior TaxID=286306 RepID=A0AAW2H620_9HYME
MWRENATPASQTSERRRRPRRGILHRRNNSRIIVAVSSTSLLRIGRETMSRGGVFPRLQRGTDLKRVRQSITFSNYI